MALGDPYVTLAELKKYVGIPVNELGKDEVLQFALDSATREIEDYCERQFNKESSATARVYEPDDRCQIEVDDFYDITGFVLETDPNGNGNFSQAWTSADYELSPLNGVISGVTGYPYWVIDAVGGLSFPVPYHGRRKATVRVTAKWGWSAIPKTIRQCCFQMASKNYSMQGAPLGVAGFGEFGVVRVRGDSVLEGKLERYRRDGVKIG